MPRKPIMQKDMKLPFWIIHTHQPFYTVMRSEDNEDYASLKSARSKGLAAVESHPIGKALAKKDYAAESLEYTRERANSMVFAKADADGDFFLEDGQDAAYLMHLMRNDCNPKPTLDPRSPALPELEDTDKKVK